MLLRTLVEKVARNRALKRRLPREFNRTPFYVSPDARLRYLRPGNAAFETELLDVAKKYIRKDSLVWDIGANVGEFTFAAASLAKDGAVLAIEADIWLAQLLQRSARLKQNSELDIQVLHTAASDNVGIATFLIASRGRASNSLETSGGRTMMGGVRQKSVVPTFTLDSLLDYFFHPTFIKIDVEGAELLVISGADRLLREVRPMLYMEIGHDVSQPITDIFSKHDYALFEINPLRRIQSCTDNTLAIPSEMVDKVIQSQA